MRSTSYSNISQDQPARECVFSVLDFETTGSVAGWPVEPWQLGIVSLRQGKVSKENMYETLLQIGERPFNPQVPGRHAQIRKELAKAPAPGEIWPEISELLCGMPLVAHNIGTERSVLSKMAPLHRFGPWIDTLQLTRRHYPGLESKALDQVIPRLKLDWRLQQLCPGREAHDALYDAFASAVLLEHFLSLPGWENVALGALI
ncbi:MAG: 3'-5' exonuclease [Kiritimatiellia bacterium]